MIITITVAPPDRRLNPNVRNHFQQLARVTKAAKKEAWAAARVAWAPFQRREGLAYAPKFKAATVAYSVIWPRHRRIVDPDNLIRMFKPHLDGIVDAGILDDDKHITLLPSKQRLMEEGEKLADASNGWTGGVARISLVVTL